MLVILLHRSDMPPAELARFRSRSNGSGKAAHHLPSPIQSESCHPLCRFSSPFPKGSSLKWRHSDVPKSTFLILVPSDELGWVGRSSNLTAGAATLPLPLTSLMTYESDLNLTLHTLLHKTGTRIGLHLKFLKPPGWNVAHTPSARSDTGIQCLRTTN